MTKQECRAPSCRDFTLPHGLKCLVARHKRGMKTAVVGPHVKDRSHVLFQAQCPPMFRRGRIPFLTHQRILLRNCSTWNLGQKTSSRVQCSTWNTSPAVPGCAKKSRSFPLSAPSVRAAQCLVGCARNPRHGSYLAPGASPITVPLSTALPNSPQLLDKPLRPARFTLKAHG